MQELTFYGNSTSYRNAFVLNLAANSIRLNNLIKKVTELNQSVQEEQIAARYYYGLLVRIVLVFPRANTTDVVDGGMADLDDEFNVTVYE